MPKKNTSKTRAQVMVLSIDAWEKAKSLMCRNPRHDFGSLIKVERQREPAKRTRQTNNTRLMVAVARYWP